MLDKLILVALNIAASRAGWTRKIESSRAGMVKPHQRPNLITIYPSCSLLFALVIHLKRTRERGKILSKSNRHFEDETIV